MAIIVPTLGLVALTLRMSQQERELGRARLADERQRNVMDTRELLLARLEGIKRSEVGAMRTRTEPARENQYGDPAVVLVAPVDDDRLVLPFDDNPLARQFRSLLNEGRFGSTIQRGEAAEFFSHRLDSAAGFYRQAVSAARHETQNTYARLLLARALGKSGLRREASVEYAAVFSVRPDIVDEAGIPLSFYAAGPLLEANHAAGSKLDRFRFALDSGLWLSPAALYRLRDLVRENAPSGGAKDTGAAIQLERDLRFHIARAEQLLALQAAFPRLPLSESRWVPYGDETWLVSLSPAVGATPLTLVALHAGNLAAELSVERSLVGAPSDGFLLSSSDSSSGALLGQEFPGLRVVFSGPSTTLQASTNLQGWFYPAVLLLAVSVTLFGSYLLWRDVRRELQLADLRSQFVSSVSHELRTPLTSIRMFAESLRMGRPAEPAAKAEYLDTIIHESERLTRLLNNVLEFSKVEQGTSVYRLVPTSLAEVASAAARALEFPLHQQGFTFRLDVPERAPVVNADADALQQAVLNLLGNSMKYSAENRVIDLRVLQRNGHAVIEVEDAGVGIAREEHARIFDKFYRAPTAANQLIAGTGLGLALVAHIARVHGGHVEVRSAPGEGSTFAIHLPVTHAIERHPPVGAPNGRSA